MKLSQKWDKEGGALMNKQLLLSVMVREDCPRKACAEAIKMSLSSFNRKLNGKSSFTVDEADNICQFLGITDAQTKVDIFLS